MFIRSTQKITKQTQVDCERNHLFELKRGVSRVDLCRNLNELGSTQRTIAEGCIVGMLLLAISATTTSCMLIGYEQATDSSEPDAKVESDSASFDADVIDAMDSTLPPVMDASRDAADKDGSVDSSQKDAPQEGAVIDDSPIEECDPGTRFCYGQILMSCSTEGTVEQEQDCRDLTNICEIGICSTTGNQCEKQPVSSDQRWCNGDQLVSCNGQGSVVAVQDCSNLSDECHIGICNETTRKCQAQPVTVGTTCLEIGWCNVFGVCACTPNDKGCDGNTLVSCSSEGQIASQEDCYALSDACNLGVCNSESNRCEAVPVTTEKYFCEGDILYTCDESGTPQESTDCSTLSNQCNAGVCDAQTNSCIQQPRDAETVCYGNGLCNEQGECTCTPYETFCHQNSLITCGSNGLIDNQQDCSLLDTECTVGVCVTDISDESTCTTENTSDNRSCSAGGVSTNSICDNQGRCVVGGNTCGVGSGGVCDISCTPGSDRCLLDCGTASTCNATCQPGTSCDIECSADTCNATCQNGATCNITCTSAINCNVVCEENAVCNVACTQSDSTCGIDCTNNESCGDISCQNQADCILSCHPEDISCGFSGCSSELSCDSTVLACNTDCPTI